MKKIISLVLSLVMLCTITTCLDFSALASTTVKSISYTPKTTYSFTVGKGGNYVEDTNEKIYFSYTFNGIQEGDMLILEYSDGTNTAFTYTSSKNGFVSSSNEVISEGDVTLDGNQESTHWVLGSSNFVTVTYNSLSTKVPVTITSSGVKSIAYTPVTSAKYVEHTNGDFALDKNDNLYFRYYEYNFAPGDKLAITFDDATTVTYTYKYLSTYGAYDFYTDSGKYIDSMVYRYTNQTATNHWKVGGDNYNTIAYLGATAQIPVTLFHNTSKVVTKATTSQNGSIATKCSICGETVASETIYSPKTISLSTTSYVYNGKTKKPTVTVKDSAGNVIATKNYTKTFSNNKSVGTATVTVTFKGDYYSGTLTKTYKIVPKGTTISKLAKGYKRITVYWKKQAVQTKGYQIQYSKSSSFASSKTSTTTKNTTTIRTLKGLSSKKKYYIRVRAYKTVNGTKYYSAWSNAKSITTK